MKPHKHAELIHAWADGATIQTKSRLGSPDFEPQWQDDCHPNWNAYEYTEYRIKPEPKPDVVYLYLAKFGLCKKFETEWANLKLTFDGETGELKSAEVLK